MSSLILAAAVLASSLAAAPAAAPKKEAVKPAPAAAKATDKVPETAKKEAPVEPAAKQAASPEAIKDAVSSLMGPCSPEQAEGKVTAVEVLDGTQLNAQLEKEKSKKPRAEPMQRFIKVAYQAGGTKGNSVRQVSTQYMLTTEQAQVLVGEKLCVFQE